MGTVTRNVVGVGGMALLVGSLHCGDDESGGGSGGGQSSASCGEPAVTEDYLTNCSTQTWIAYETYSPLEECFIGSRLTFSADETMRVENGCTGQTLSGTYKLSGRLLTYEDATGDERGGTVNLAGADLELTAFDIASFKMRREGGSSGTGGSGTGASGTGASGTGASGTGTCDGSTVFSAIGQPCGLSVPRCEEVDGVPTGVRCSSDCVWEVSEECMECPPGSEKICVNTACGCSALPS